DMLGEAAKTAEDAAGYLQSYLDATKAVGARNQASSVFAAQSISVKLSALHPRYEYVKRERILSELVPNLLSLASAAKSFGIGLTIDAEEADRLDLSLDIFEKLAAAPELAGWNGLGLAVQAYQKRALPVLDFIADLASQTGRRLPVRLVKGAYWDTEIKRAQIAGLPSYPVFTRKISTDTNYLACARALLSRRDRFFPQFATHNAHTVAAVQVFAGDNRDFEFQRLHGMGSALYAQIVEGDGKLPVRVYAPVGGYEHLLAYLVRRLLENGANTSFVNRLADDEAPIAEIIADPVDAVAALDDKPHPNIVLPAQLYAPERQNSAGLLLSDPAQSAPLLSDMRNALQSTFLALPLIAGEARDGKRREITDPADHRRVIGYAVDSNEEDIDAAFASAGAAQNGWDERGGEARAKLLERAADIFQAQHAKLMALIVREGGRSVQSALYETREAIDFLRYYAVLARADFAHPRVLKGPTGERNEYSLHGRGVFACISPWNFPLSIFTGQVAAALAAGNTVIAKPAEQTPLTGALAVSLLHEAGIPRDVLHLLPGDGAVGGKIVGHPLLAGIAFTGSTATAAIIRNSLAAKGGPIIPFIAETGGINAMIVDSTALLEQVVSDVISSAFDSAGQRCSAARLLCVQDDIADNLLKMLAGAMAELKIGDPMDLSTDVGPVIDEDARASLRKQANRLEEGGKLVRALEEPDDLDHGTFFSPMVFEIERIEDLSEEIFGPVLAVYRYKREALDRICDEINAMGYGLTLGIHSRLDEVRARIMTRIKAGNVYFNRNQIGAVVGVQPFGGRGLSGTGPKAGGPYTLHAFATEQSLSIDTTAAGGNAALLMLKDGQTPFTPDL
ncbi:MAG: bifunctional proline dehydrogenase/L-glutamate gamma-semialdehyde dehydrogenase PutA, partial [Alphaproteobacteria bacterium]